MDWDKDLGRYVWTKEDWLFALPAIIGGFGTFILILIIRWFYTGLWLW